MQKQFDAFANAQLLLQHQYRPALVVLRASDLIKQELIYKQMSPTGVVDESQPP